MDPWKDKFDQGVKCFRLRRYEEALEHFSAALDTGGDGYPIRDSRAAVYQKLGKVKEALQDSKAAIDLQPRRWQGYSRSAQLFFQLRKLPASMRMVDLALERMSPDKNTQRAAMAELRSKIQSALDEDALQASRLISQQAYHFGNLPMEIAHTIFAVLLDDDHAYVVRLAQVCKQWRATILGAPACWRTLVLSERSPKRKLNLWKERSRDHIQHLHILVDFANDSDIPEGLSSLSTSSLITLRLRGIRLSHIPRYLPSIASAIVQPLRAWDGASPVDVAGVVVRNEHEISFHCTDLSLPKSTTLCDWIHLVGTLEDLNTLTVDSPGDNWIHLLWLLHKNPRLTALDIQRVHPRAIETEVAPDNRHIPSTVVLPKLHSLCLNRANPNRILSRLQLTALKELQIATCQIVFEAPFFQSNYFPISQLTSLSLSAVVFLPQPFMNLLESAVMLETLHLIAVGERTAGPILEFLAQPRTLPDDHSSDSLSLPHVRCPSIRHLDCSQNPDVTGGPLVRLVKLRIPTTEKSVEDVLTIQGDQAPSVVPLQSLRIDGCPQVDHGVLPWLRQAVPVVSCVYMTKKAAGWKR
ncbi:uncharacterized protein BXZ73DRAFT_87153 [Epithele typhae]|uniref:uncharacterized protein n=1 Tax=Epithele typhae TaxID=378194 RepID=UPI0020082DB1|nr:uncharacterized protein BXZ73DRAFT_87153 [Epithele typhae]KAH9944206.1 hypothetical protein BXZ73DRAFT_87153 [Epithele typhae]